MTARKRATLVLALTAALGTSCARSREPKASAWLVVTTAPDRGVDVTQAHAEGAGVLGATRSGGTLAVEVDPSAHGDVIVTANGACPLSVPATALRAGRTEHRALLPWLDFGEIQAQVGFDTPFSITAQPSCAAARAGSITWQQVTGAAVRDAHVEDHGFRFSARTIRLEDALGGPPSFGIVPLSPRTRGEAAFDVTWSGSDGGTRTRRVAVSAATRARGLPNVVVGARLYLGGDAWRVVAAPPGSHAALESHDGFAALAPDVRGAFTLGDGHSHTLRLVAGKYDETPLDCGQSDCHSDVARIARSSPMTTVLERGLATPFGGDYPACANGCHTVGESGMDDGGFAAVLHSLGRSFADLARAGFHDLPAPLQRLGGVGCLGCHGPGAIPEPAGRHALLRSDVCATCHDAPPRYGHVVGWRASNMARADADPRTREEPCARCHTTWGALGRAQFRPPPEAPPAGIACAACHSVHPASHGAPVLGQTCTEALPRDAAVPPILADAVGSHAKKSLVCLSCHTPLADDESPMASAAAIWSGRGGLDPATGAPLSAKAPHGDVEGGCIACHKDGPSGLEHGTNHAFQARRADCPACHTASSDPSIATRASALFRALTNPTTLTSQMAVGAPHTQATRLDRSTARGRAAWDVALVLEDPAADVHNAPYARLLLDAAERISATRAFRDAPTGGRR